MAFEQLYKNVDQLADQYERLDGRGMIGEARSYLEALVIMYETTLSNAKFKHQRLYCKAKIQRLNPSFAEGYFGRNRNF